MCGIAAVLNKSENIQYILYELLSNLQHRGQNSSGLVLYDNKNNKTYETKELGLVDNNLKNIHNFRGTIGIGHVRYATQGLITSNEIQPFCDKDFLGISLSHNGNITNSNEIFNILHKNNIKCISTSDSESVLKLFIYLLKKEIKTIEQLNNNIVFKVVKQIIDICRGSFSIIIMINGFGLVCFRDVYGIRPLVYCNSDNCVEIASETVGLRNSNYKNVGNGEVIVIKCMEQILIDKKKIYNCPLTPCLFEYIYFARPESYINDILVYEYREKIAEKLVKIINKSDEIVNKISNVDCVIPVPLTGLISGIRIGELLKKPIKNAIIKNRYTHRSFINKDNEAIIKAIKKIKIIDKLVNVKNILIVDDSIVRGNTSKHIIEELKKGGANKIYLVSCCPPIRYPNKYGIAIPTKEELIANNKTIEDIKNELKVDELIYLDINTLCNTLKEINPKITNFEKSVFTGEYIT
tara:strand:+ start:186 stop:1583 length:1398 start_codon:yes stop_codon:yes gene_type:complete